MNARTKAKNDMALNLTELAVVTGYSYSSLKAMHLPLAFGKMRLRDFWRFLSSRMVATEMPAAYSVRSPSLTAEEARILQATSDKFRAPRLKSDRLSASPSPAAHHARNTA
jgi:hypothetical protein